MFKILDQHLLCLKRFRLYFFVFVLLYKICAIQDIQNQTISTLYLN